MVKESVRARTFGVTLTFASAAERDEALKFLNSEGRKPAAYMLYLLTREIEHTRQKVVGAPVNRKLFGG